MMFTFLSSNQFYKEATMGQKSIFFIHDMQNILNDKKTVFLIAFLTLLTIFFEIFFNTTLRFDTDNLLNQLKIISDIDDIELFSLYMVYIFCFIIFTTYPFIIGIFIVSHIKEFGELELMMIFPINRKHFFIGKCFSIFIISLIFSWISILINLFIHSIIFNFPLSFNFYKVFYCFISLPTWLFSLSCLTVVISSLAKDSKEANQKSIILAIILYSAIQFVFIFKINIFNFKIVFVPLVFGIIILIGVILFASKKITIEKILYN